MSETSNKAKLAMIQALSTFMDSGPSNATITFYEGIRATNPETNADSNNALVTMDFPEPCLKSITASHIELYGTDPTTIIKTGTATWARIYNGSGEAVVDLSIGTDITISNANLVLGGMLAIQSIKFSP